MTRPFALLSVHDKSGLVDFARGLTPHFDLLASGGTARVLTEAGLEVLLVEDLTGFPALLGGRVKTLHPAIHAGLLSRRTEADNADLERFKLPEIGLVAVSLYPFEQAVADSRRTNNERIEEIDIGGVALLRAAAKNHAHVFVVPGPDHYAYTLSALSGDVPTDTARRRLAALTMQRTASYDMAIARWLGDLADADTDAPKPDTSAHLARLFPDHRVAQPLRYGENPHQEAVYLEPQLAAPAYRQLSGKELSYNNLLDLDAAWSAVSDFDTPTCVIVKHGSPCGIASALPWPRDLSRMEQSSVIAPSDSPSVDARFIAHSEPTLATLVRRAIAADPTSAFGGILATNGTLDLDAALATGDLFLEIVAAPDITAEAAAHLARTKKNCRVLVMAPRAQTPVVRSALGGLLVQTPDELTPEPTLFKPATRPTTTPVDLALCAFAWSTVKHLKSNAIAVCLKDGETFVTAGLGAGQTNRIDATRQALERAKLRYPDLGMENGRHAVLASDAFFPFPDGVEAAAHFGVEVVIQPGGALRDPDVIAAAERLGVTLLLTGRRHFRH